MKLLGLPQSASILAICCISLCVDAAEPGERRLFLGGFGTIGAIYHDTEGIEYRRHQGQPRGAEANEVDFATDSLAGVQLNAAWNEELEAVAQLLTRLDSDNTWRPRVTRGFLRYRPIEETIFRAGRIGYELLPLTDSRDIGYSYLTIRPPVELLGLLPHDEFDGADVVLTHPLGAGIGRMKLYGGLTSGRLVFSEGSVDLRDSKIWGGHVEYLSGAWVTRLGHGYFLSPDPPAADPLADALRQTGSAQAIALADELAEDERRVQFSVFGLSYEEDALHARLVLARTSADHITGPKTRSGFVVVGYGIGTLTPYIAVSAIKGYDSPRSTGLPDTPSTAPLNAAAMAAQSNTQTHQATYSLGIRYDVAPKMDIKLQVDRVLLHSPNTTLDRNTPPRRETDMTVLGVAFDFIF